MALQFVEVIWLQSSEQCLSTRRIASTGPLTKAVMITKSKLFAASLAAFLILTGCGKPDLVEKGRDALAPQVNLAEVKPQVEAFCGNCHAVPPPESFPRDRWLHEVDRGFEFYVESGRTDLIPPPRGKVVAYFQSLAPERLVIAAPKQVADSRRFRRAELQWPVVPLPDCAVSYLLKLGGAGNAPMLASCDMLTGETNLFSFAAGEISQAASVKLEHPDHICQTDLDGDGKVDFLLADLGSFPAKDHDRGRVVWVRPRSEGQSGYEQIVLLDRVGRVADAQAGDFDGDGDLDVVVAEFGWHKTGGIWLLWQDGEKDGWPRFRSEIIDRRTGPIHTPVGDVNGDGLLDFVAIIAQEHESIEAFVNLGNGTFERQVIYRAPDPSFGSSGIQLVDFDSDGDLDVLYTNGDTYDSFYVKPTHSVGWVENRGMQGWQNHLLTLLPGALRALAADVDGDGDLDVVACSFIPPRAMARQPEITETSSLIWLERRGGEFVRHVVETNNCVHSALEITDVNADGRLDIVVGESKLAGENAMLPISIWLNQPH
jgi:hypothetical protein